MDIGYFLSFAIRMLRTFSGRSVVDQFFTHFFFYLAFVTMAEGSSCLAVGQRQMFCSWVKVGTGLVAGAVRCIPLTRAPSLHHRREHELRKHKKKKS